jgi:hypothetical protein
MEHLLTASAIARISRVLNVKPKRIGNVLRFEIANQTNQRTLAVEIYSNIDIGIRKGTLVTVYTPTAHLQLHFCTGFVASTLLGEVTFVGEQAGTLSGLTIEREGGCSLYANVDRSLLSGDFTRLGPEVMMSGVALSLAESVLPAMKATKKILPRTARKVALRKRKLA